MSSYQSINITSDGISVINISNGGSTQRSSSKTYVSISNGGIQCYSSSSVSVTNSPVFINNGESVTTSKKKKKSSKASKQPKPQKPLEPLKPLKSQKSPNIKTPKPLPAPHPDLVSTTNRNVQPEEGYCWLLLFKSKYWNNLRSTFGPNTLWFINTPDNVLRQFMSQNPRMVSSRRDLLQRQTGPKLYHLTPGGNRSPWDIMGF